MVAKTVEEAVDDNNADLSALLIMQAFMIADLASQTDDPLGRLHTYSDNISQFIIEMPIKDDGVDAEAVRSRMLKTVQRTLDSVAGGLSKAFPKSE